MVDEEILRLNTSGQSLSQDSVSLYVCMYVLVLVLVLVCMYVCIHPQNLETNEEILRLSIFLYGMSMVFPPSLQYLTRKIESTLKSSF